MKVNELVFHYVHLLYYKCYKMNPNQGESYVDSRDWIKNEKAAINSIKKKKKDNEFSQYIAIVALNLEEMGKHSERRTKTKPFINKYNWKEITFPPEKDDWKKIEKIM